MAKQGDKRAVEYEYDTTGGRQSVQVTEECILSQTDDDGAHREVWRTVPEDGKRLLEISQKPDFVDWL